MNEAGTIGRKDLARKIQDRCLLSGNFMLRSGVESNEYFDKYLFESDPALLKAVSEELRRSVPRDTEVIAGLELGGIPLAVMLSSLTGIPSAFVRKQAKEYGTLKLAEGAEIAERRVLLVEDVVTSGGQVILSAKALRELGAHLDTVLCVIDRESGGSEALSREGLTLNSLFTRSELIGGG